MEAGKPSSSTRVRASVSILLRNRARVQADPSSLRLISPLPSLNRGNQVPLPHFCRPKRCFLQGSQDDHSARSQGSSSSRVLSQNIPVLFNRWIDLVESYPPWSRHEGWRFQASASPHLSFSFLSAELLHFVRYSGRTEENSSSDQGTRPQPSCTS